MQHHRLLTARFARAFAVGLLLGACGATVDDPGGSSMSYNCNAPPANLATCAVDGDCTTVAIGCYCGAQPINGVARVYATAAQSCQDTAASTCALGCATEFYQIAQDNRKVMPGTPIVARCDHATTTATCKSYVP